MNKVFKRSLVESIVNVAVGFVLGFIVLCIMGNQNSIKTNFDISVTLAVVAIIRQQTLRVYFHRHWRKNDKANLSG